MYDAASGCIHEPTTAEYPEQEYGALYAGLTLWERCASFSSGYCSGHVGTGGDLSPPQPDSPTRLPIADLCLFSGLLLGRLRRLAERPCPFANVM
jgi:hypothetical protein